MEQKDLKFIEVSDYYHMTGSTNAIVDKFRRLVESKLIDVDKVIFVTIDYNVYENNVTDGPVHLYTKDGVEVVLNLSAGYGGSGPTDLCYILKLCKFDFVGNEIKTHNTVGDVCLRYIKSDTAFQIKNYAEEYVYSM